MDTLTSYSVLTHSTPRCENTRIGLESLVQCALAFSSLSSQHAPIHTGAVLHVEDHAWTGENLNMAHLQLQVLLDGPSRASATVLARLTSCHLGSLESFPCGRSFFFFLKNLQADSGFLNNLRFDLNARRGARSHWRRPICLDLRWRARVRAAVALAGRSGWRAVINLERSGAKRWQTRSDHGAHWSGPILPRRQLIFAGWPRKR